MKRIIIILLTILVAAGFWGCEGNNGFLSGIFNRDSKKGSLPGEVNFDKDASYAIGLNVGASLREGMAADEVYPDIDQFLMGMRDGIEGRQPRFDLDRARELIEEAFNALLEAKSAEAMLKENDYLAANARKAGVNITASGLQYEVVYEGGGEKPEEDDVVLVHYRANFIDGTSFDSSHDRGQPQNIELTQVISGWREGLMLMNAGSKYIFTIPSALGYGEHGMINHWTGEVIIPPYATLIFEVELLEINPEM
jgi:FKBP-type peptidyl-prolyl cis-trans isomerase